MYRKGYTAVAFTLNCVICVYAMLHGPLYPISFAVVWIPAYISGSACLWLLLLIWRIRPSARMRLFPRQMWQLAACDLIYSFARLIRALIDVWVIDSAADEFSCIALWSISRGALVASLLTTLHIAVGFTCAYFRVERALELLDRSLIWLGRAGCLLCIVQSIGCVSTPSKRVERYFMWCHCDRRINGFLDIVLKSCGIISLALYTLALSHAVKNRRNANSTAWQVLLRMCAYFGVFILSYGPRSILANTPAGGNIIVGAISFALLGLNGVLNMSVYVWQSGMCAAVSDHEHAQSSAFGSSITERRGRSQDNEMQSVLDNVVPPVEAQQSIPEGYCTDPCHAMFLGIYQKCPVDGLPLLEVGTSYAIEGTRSRFSSTTSSFA
eukprot:TRINITY_DN21102_c0_g1_i1.p1 TRINITY_DN21102_c0_g1~~TRINITY_DN21102_c0_g1_i1.p1  ORF type:complete len:382 (+),score=6.53 TRINITY_DN21102_c0_g1_i1:42-1187(+)